MHIWVVFTFWLLLNNAPMNIHVHKYNFKLKQFFLYVLDISMESEYKANFALSEIDNHKSWFSKENIP